MNNKFPNIIAEIQNSPDSGFLLIDKPAGEPSFKTVSQLRQITGQKKIGFAGTLDPAASGLLIIGINKATKLLDYWHQFPKEYEAEITLGKVSTTYDGEGVISEVSSKEFRPEGDRPVAEEERDITAALLKFTGTVGQVPPMYSAKSIGGKRLYELARAGKEVERQPATVTIHSIDILEYDYPLLKLRVKCSTGTYIRSLAHDLGQALGAGAYLSALRRTAIGPCQVSQAVSVRDITRDNWPKQVIDVTNLS
ncbi:MAG: tRNA pseudouridine(55) synthase TruB [Candidatus Komeilibacteria bacterium]